ncbi:MAG: hypothetical protein WC781_05205 [Candidatus Pacearchaeota archaeon]|jgi:hypothetical protein
MIKEIWQDKRARTAIKLFTVILTIGIITMLLFSAPANALSIGFGMNKQNVSPGERVIFDVVVNAPIDQAVNSLTLVLDGPQTNECVFDVNGNMLSSCSGIASIIATRTTTEAGYGYGYGYGYLFGYGYSGGEQELRYTVTLNTLGFAQGDYSTQIKVVSGSQIITRAGGNLRIGTSIINQTTSSSTTTSHYHAVTKTYKIGSELVTRLEGQTGDNNRFDVSNGDAFKLMSSNGWNDMKISSVNGDSVVLTIDSNDYLVKLGEAIEIDVDGNGKTDLSVSILFIGNGEATALINSYNAQIMTLGATTFQSNLVPSLSTDSSIYEKLAEKSGFNFFEGFNNQLLNIIALIIANLIVLELIGIVYVRNKRRVKKVRKRR